MRKFRAAARTVAAGVQRATEDARAASAAAKGVLPQGPPAQQASAVLRDDSTRGQRDSEAGAQGKNSSALTADGDRAKASQ